MKKRFKARVAMNGRTETMYVEADSYSFAKSLIESQIASGGGRIIFLGAA